MSKTSIFEKVKMVATGSSKFDLSHDVKLSFNMGKLIPTCVLDVIPGDKFKINVNNFLRFQPLIAPIMHKVRVKTDFFFVPNRILWPTFEDYITGELIAEHPFFNTLSSANPGTLADYLGFPQATALNNTQLHPNVLPVAAYYKIYDEYYRDQNLQTEKFVPVITGYNASYVALAVAQPLNRAWQHDYFTSCLPFAQKGDAVQLPLLNDQSVDVVRKTFTTPGSVPTPILRSGSTGLGVDGAVTTATNPDAGNLHANGNPATFDPNGSLEVDVNSEAATINDLRKAFRLQEWLEKNARGGTRYIEHIKAHFGVFSSDKRLQRPEYIGGSTQNMVISEVLSSAQTDPSGTQEIPIGQMAGHGISAGGGNSFSYSAEEHGWIMGIISVTPDTAYQQGLPKMFNRKSYLDYYYPSFANLGEQEVLNSELYIGNETNTILDETFGYIPRYAEYKYMSNRVAGDLKGTLAMWHLGRIFTTKPSLNSTFITCEPDRRIFAVDDPTEDSIIGHVFNNISAIRKMPKYGTPTI
jgi:hypothetical protein